MNKEILILLYDVEKFIAGDDSQIMHPQRWNRQGILNKMKDMWVFSCQMMLEPVDAATKRFNPDMIRRYDIVPDAVENVLNRID